MDHHRNVGLKSSRLPNYLLLSLVFSYVYIWQGSVKMHLQCSDIAITLLHINRRVCQWKNFRNRSIIGKDKDRKVKCHVFIGPQCIERFKLVA